MLPATPHRNTRAAFQACIGGSPNSCWRGRRGAQPSVVRGKARAGPGCAGAPRRTFVGTQNPEVRGDWQPLTQGGTGTYLDKFDAVQAALKRGDIYEMNLCMPWQGKAPARQVGRCSSVWQPPQRRTRHPGWRPPCLVRKPRAAEKRGQTLRSQPIKGTVRRGGTPEEDDALKRSLLESEKERAENVMIVDLVRNDLSRVAQPNSVKVDELFGLHTFSTVHQMISTISCQLQPEATAEDVLRATFPMGSMTGAPKLSAMDLIAYLEGHGRGVYSGTIGYVDALGDWDFNVVIRSLMHQADTGRVDATVGGALTLLAQATTNTTSACSRWRPSNPARAMTSSSNTCTKPWWLRMDSRPDRGGGGQWGLDSTVLCTF